MTAKQVKISPKIEGSLKKFGCFGRIGSAESRDNCTGQVCLPCHRGLDWVSSIETNCDDPVAIELVWELVILNYCIQITNSLIEMFPTATRPVKQSIYYLNLQAAVFRNCSGIVLTVTQPSNTYQNPRKPSKLTTTEQKPFNYQEKIILFK